MANKYSHRVRYHSKLYLTKDSDSLNYLAELCERTNTNCLVMFVNVLGFSKGKLNCVTCKQANGSFTVFLHVNNSV